MSRTIYLNILIVFLVATAGTVWAQEGVITKVRDAEVLYVNGNEVVFEEGGEVKHVTVAEDYRLVVNGKEISVRDLKPGTKLTQTITTVTQPQNVEVTEVTRATVWHVDGNNVVLTHENGERQAYNVPNWFQFERGGQMVTARQLRRGDVVTKTVVSTERRLVSQTTEGAVTGRSAAPPRQAAAPAAAPSPRPAAARQPAPAPQAAPTQVAQAGPATLPTTASPLPLIGILGVVAFAGVAGIRLLRNRLS
jgi:hypothetical protein